jgi:hypothetical protein
MTVQVYSLAGLLRWLWYASNLPPTTPITFYSPLFAISCPSMGLCQVVLLMIRYHLFNQQILFQEAVLKVDAHLSGLVFAKEGGIPRGT